MQARMKNPALVLPEAMPAIMALQAATESGGVPASTLGLVHLRASQINGCSACVEGGACHMKANGESDGRLFAVAAWRDSTSFSEAERAALALTESVTRLSDQTDPVPDTVWEEATRFYDEKALSALLLSIATTNVFNRLNVATRQLPGGW